MAMLLAFGLASTFPNAVRSEDVKTPVYIDGKQDNTTGERFVYLLKEGIRGSLGMRLVNAREDSLIQAFVTTLDPDRNAVHIAYAVVITARNLSNPETRPLYLTSSVGMCGRNRIASCAESIIADTSEEADNIRAVIDSVAREGKRLPRASY